MSIIKLSAISDLHGNLPNPDFFIGGDVLCICGDIVPLDLQQDVIKSVAWFCMKFVPWTDMLPYKKIILVFGNHDFFAEELGSKHFNSADKVLSMLLPGSIKGEHKIQILMDNSYKYMGLTFYGTSWCPDLSNWAFYGDHDKLTCEFSKIPQKCDVLLSHCPPRLGYAGTVLQNGTFNYLHDYGCQELADATNYKNIKWLLCGHVHSGDHHILDIDGDRMNVVNVSMLDENYKKSYEPFDFEIER